MLQIPRQSSATKIAVKDARFSLGRRMHEETTSNVTDLYGVDFRFRVVGSSLGEVNNRRRQFDLIKLSSVPGP
jgi:hypothetical protein